MRLMRLLVPCVILVAACDSKAKDQLRSLAHADSLRTDSLMRLKNDLLDEVMTSTQFVNDLNSEVSKLKSRTAGMKLSRSSRKSPISLRSRTNEPRSCRESLSSSPASIRAKRGSRRSAPAPLDYRSMIPHSLRRSRSTSGPSRISVARLNRKRSNTRRKSPR